MSGILEAPRGAGYRCKRMGRRTTLPVACLLVLSMLQVRWARAQQFNCDNQWTAPHGVATLAMSVGQEYSMFQAVAALRPGFEFNVGVNRFKEDPDEPADDHYSSSIYLKFRLWENEAQNGGAAVVGGTGHSPSYLKEGKVIDTFRSWWLNGIYTIPFADGTYTWDLMPGGIVNLDKDRTGAEVWNFTYGTRAAVYKVVPSSALVGEVFGTVGEDHTPIGYRVGLRWEHPRLILAGTYGRQFDGAGGPRLEVGALWLTNPLSVFCLGGGCDRGPAQ